MMTTGKWKKKKLKCSADEGGGVSAGSDAACGFDKLPAEILDIILGRVMETDWSTGIRARLVCRRWSNVLKAKLLLTANVTDATIQDFVESDPDIPMKLLMLSALGNKRVREIPVLRQTSFRSLNYSPEGFSRSVQHLVIGGDAGMVLKTEKEADTPYSLSTGFAEEQNLLTGVKQSISGDALVNILQQVYGVKTLSISSVGLMSTSRRMLKQIGFNNFSILTILDICIGKKSCCAKMTLFFKIATFPALSSLYVRVYFSCMSFKMYVAWVLFVARHRRLLRKLSLSQSQAYYAVPFYPYEHSDLAIESYPNLREHLMEIKLEFLRIDCMVFGHPIGDKWKTLEREFIKNQSQLRSLEIQIILRSIDVTLDQLLPACEDSLERLEISSAHFRPNVFNCAIISKFKKLRQCHFFLRNPLFRIIDNERPYFAQVTNLQLLPSTIVCLHLGNMPDLSKIRMLAQRLVNLEKISYGNGEVVAITNAVTFIRQLVEHFRFPKLTELRIYQNPFVGLLRIINEQKGMCCFVEDCDTLVILIDRDVFNVNLASRHIFLSLLLRRRLAILIP